MDDQIDEQTLNGIYNILLKAFRTCAEVTELNQLLLKIHDYRDYTSNFTEVMKNKLCRVMTYAQFEQSDLIFRKGDESDVFYFILSGKIDLYEGYKQSEDYFVRNMRQGESMGERGILNDEERSLTAFAHTQCRLVAVEAKDFKNIMGIQVRDLLENKIKFIQTNMPMGRYLGRTQLEKIAYSIDDEKMLIGQQAIHKGEVSHKLYLIHAGECAIKSSSFTSPVIRLGVGSMFGDEGTLYNKPSRCNIYVVSDVVHLYVIKRGDLVGLFTPTVINALRNSSKTRYKARQNIQLLQSKFTSKQAEEPLELRDYPHVSPRAKAAVLTQIRRATRPLTTSVPARPSTADRSKFMSPSNRSRSPQEIPKIFQTRKLSVNGSKGVDSASKVAVLGIRVNGAGSQAIRDRRNPSYAVGRNSPQAFMTALDSDQQEPINMRKSMEDLPTPSRTQTAASPTVRFTSGEKAINPNSSTDKKQTAWFGRPLRMEYCALRDSVTCKSKDRGQIPRSQKSLDYY